MTIFDLQVEEEATIVWPSPVGIKIRELGLSFATGSYSMRWNTQF